MWNKIISCNLAVLLSVGMFSACGSTPVQTDSVDFAALTVSPVSTAVSSVSDTALSGEETAIVLCDSGSICEATGVQIDGSTIRITEAGDFILSGSLSDGQIVVDAPKDANVKLILDGVSIVKSGHAAIYAVSADKLVLSTAEGSENLLQSTDEFVSSGDSRVDAAVFAKCDLTLSGDGILNISSLTGHAVVSKDDLKLKSGTVNIEAANKGFCGKDSVRIEGGVLNADVGTDGICSENSEDREKGTITIESGVVNLLCQKDGLDASGDILIAGGEIIISAGSGQEGKGIESDADITVSGGSLSVNAVDDAIHASGSVCLSGGSLLLSTGDDGVHADAALTLSGSDITVNQSYEGLEAQVITVSDGTIRVNARDDGFNAAGGNDSSNSMGFFGGDPFETDGDASLTISGGTIFVNAEGDGLDSNGYLYMSGGAVYVSGPTNGGNGALDYGIDAVISGGTILAAGAAGMAENFGQNSSQGSILINLSSTQAAGSSVSVSDENGNILASFAPEKSYSSVVVSTAGLIQGGTYTVSAGTERQTVTLSSLIYGTGGMMGGMAHGGFGAMPGQMLPEGEAPAGFGAGPMGGPGRRG